MNCNTPPKCDKPCGDCTQEWPRPDGAQSPAEAHGDLIAAAKRVSWKFGHDETGTPSDWSEWVDLRAAIAAAEKAQHQPKVLEPEKLSPSNAKPWAVIECEGFPVRYPHPDEDDAVALWAEIHRLRAAVQGPDGYATWQDAAVAERVRRVAAEKELAAIQAPAPAHEIEAIGEIVQIDSGDDEDGPHAWVALYGEVALGTKLYTAQSPAVGADRDVTRILLDVVPGIDGMGEEVYAKSVAEVEAVLTRMGQQIEDLAGAAQDAARWRWWRANYEVNMVVTIFGNGCINKTIGMVEAHVDAAISYVPVQPMGGE